MHNKLFAPDLPHCKPLEFAAEGFRGDVSGIIYGPEAPPTNGMPLGGIDTGCLDIEASGNLGYMNIFNSYWPKRG